MMSLMMRLAVAIITFATLTAASVSFTRPAKCMQPAVTGPCRAMYRRYHFNSTAGVCQKFTYGGCGGNDNNYLTKQQCDDECAPVPVSRGGGNLNCSRNEVYESCGNKCEEKCGNPMVACATNCEPPACACARGFARHADGSCVPKQSCQSLARPDMASGSMHNQLNCSRNEVRNPCGNHCERKCGVRTNICTLQCGPPACACKGGYARHSNGSCVPDNRCPPSGEPIRLKCGRNEVADECGNHCDEKCGVKHSICTLQCGPPACACIRGYARHANGSCVAKHNCQAAGSHYVAPVQSATGPVRVGPMSCGRNEVVDGCGNHCEKKCGDKLNICTLQCAPPACACKDGYARHYNGSCVPENQCQAAASGQLPAKCRLPASPGFCLANFQRYHYNVTTGSCQRFTWGGCGGNENNFRTEAECMKDCSTGGGSSGRTLRPISNGGTKLNCSRNEVEDECGNQCEELCDRHRFACNLMCGPPACACKTGYARHSNGSCIAKEHCVESSANVQCHPSLDYCWCVDPVTGAEVPNTRKFGTIKRCPSADHDPPKGPCAAALEDTNAASNGRPMIGRFVPTCAPTGFYALVQCHGSTGHCWCVNVLTGAELNGTRTPPGRGQPKCPEAARKAHETLNNFMANINNHIGMLHSTCHDD